MMLIQLRRSCLILFLVLLGAQLTGLSCLNDVPSADPLRISELAYVSGAMATNDGGPFAEDSCPCHLTFASVRDASVVSQGPFHPLAVGPVLVWNPLLAAFLFHPPNVL